MAKTKASKKTARVDDAPPTPQVVVQDLYVPRVVHGRFKHLRPHQRRFLEAFLACGSVKRAAEAAKVSSRTHSHWLAHDPLYRMVYETQAVPEANQILEDEAVRRAVEGVDEPIFFQGEVCGFVRKYSDGLLQFLMKGRIPERYRDQWKGELTGPGGGPIDLTSLSEEELRTFKALADKAAAVNIGAVVGEKVEETNETGS